MSILRYLTATVFILITLAAGAFSQRSPKPAVKNILFALHDDGKTLEPIAFVGNGKLSEIGEEGSGPAAKQFAAKYYRKGQSYDLIFGGSVAGKVAVVKAMYPGECAGNMASASPVQKPTPVLKGMVMALATNARTTDRTPYRKAPSSAQRNEIELLVRAEFRKHGATTSELRYHNLTALDINSDEKAELVGSYWIAPKKDERQLLFFIAEPTANGKYSFTHSKYDRVTLDKMMDGAEMSHVDSGIAHELLLDMFDYDGDGVSEIFTIGKAFEGNNFYVYRKQNVKWVKVFDTYNYRCGF